MQFGSNKNLKILENNYEALKNSNGLILVTEWNEFRKPDFEKMKKMMKTHVIFDGRNIYNPKTVTSKGFKYFGIGR
jgi:UDPglucose 6-dehydrogenase